MEMVLHEVGVSNLNGFDLVFVPIIQESHFYMVSFNLKESKVEVIDNSGAMPDMSVAKKYSGWPGRLVTQQKSSITK
jgi:predicted AAA+ superfamily ATPase